MELTPIVILFVSRSLKGDPNPKSGMCKLQRGTMTPQCYLPPLAGGPHGSLLQHFRRKIRIKEHRLLQNARADASQRLAATIILQLNFLRHLPEQQDLGKSKVNELKVFFMF